MKLCIHYPSQPPPFKRDDSITAQLLHCFQSYLLSDFSDKHIIQHILYYFNNFLQKPPKQKLQRFSIIFG